MSWLGRHDRMRKGYSETSPFGTVADQPGWSLCGLVTRQLMAFDADKDEVLVVEDDDELLDALCDCLKDEDVSCTKARTGSDALEWLRAGLRPKVILLDLEMPEMGGPEFLRERSREDPEIASVPVVVLTEGLHGEEAPKLGAVAVVKKSTNIETLLDVLRPYLRERTSEG
jgi:CheY-like chemotaxis protein